MSTIIRIIEPATPENIRRGDYITLRRRLSNGRHGVEVRGTVVRWDHVYADWLTMAGWPNQRFSIDGETPRWAVTRIQREEEVENEGVPFRAGYATIDDVAGAERRPGILLDGRFYVIHGSDGTYRPSHWYDFRTTD